MRSRLLRSLLVGAALTTLFVTGGDRLRAVSGGVVISQVSGGGGNTGAQWKNDFIELFNRGASPVNLSGMSVQYASSTGSTWAVTALPAVTLAPGQYLLVQEAAGAGAQPNLPTPDASGTIAMAAGAGKVALSATTTALTGVCPSGVVDFVGYGAAANCFEGTAPTATLTNTTAAIRAGNGCTDTDNNNTDFATGAPSPRNTATTAAPCGGGDTAPSVSSTSPAANAINVSVNATIVINFSESVTASAGAFTLECPTGAPLTFTQTASPATSFTLTPSAPLPAGTTCTVKVTANQITDTDSTDPPDAMAADFNVSFSTASPADAAPFVISTTPANLSVNVPVTSPIVINFSESVTATPAAFAIVCGGVPQPFMQSGAPSTSYTLTPSSALPFSTSCTVTVTGNQIFDTDANDPPDTATSNVTFTFTTPPPGAGTVRINEVDADTPGTDTAEFIELYDGGTGNTPLDGLVVVFFDGGTTGSGNQSTVAFDLDGYTTDAQGYFVMGNPGVPGASLIFEPGEFGLLGNGPDAVALYIGNATDFPTGTIRTTTNLQDAIVYGTDDPSASGLVALLNAGQKVANENATGNSQTQSSQRCPTGMGGFRNTAPYYPGAPTPGAANTCPAARPPSDVVISQIYGGGGNSGATYANDYVELYNKGTVPADLTGWSLQYASSTGSGWDSNKQPLGGSIGAGEYYLIALASGGANGASVPPANIAGQINMAAGSGKIALVASFTGLVGNCPVFDPTIKDLVGYGSADCGEGATTTSAGSNTTALFRKNDGSLDTDNNASDFLAPAAPSPRRTAPIVELGPNVLVSDPRSNATNAPRDATIQVTFTEPVDVDAGWFSLVCATSGSHYSATFAVGFGGKDHYITPNDNFTAGEQCTVTILKNRIHDQDSDDSGPNTDTLPADYAWVFTVATGTEPPYAASVHLTMGNPSAAGADPANYLMEKPEFTLSYNRDLGRPNWVSWHLSDEWVGTLSRVDTFRPDPQVPPDWYRVQSFDFSGSGFDRGHMTPNADRDKETSSPINQATFLMSNMVAQAPGNNQGPWASFEGHLRTFVEQQQSEVYIVSGPFGTGGTGSNGGVTMTLADGHVAVPSSTWKVALVLPKADGDDRSRVSCSTQTIAVIMPNLDSIREIPWQNYLTTVDAVEALTGYDFFANLPEPYQRCIEAGINGNNPPLVKGDQTIAFAQPADHSYTDPAFSVFATGGASGNPVTFVASGACTSSGLTGSTITLTAPGTCTITASQAGSEIYNAAPDVVRTFAVTDTIPPTVTYTGNVGTYGVLATISIQCTATDAGSGVVSTTCADITGPAYAFPVGLNTFSATATDAAGNIGSGMTSFQVVVTFADLQALVSQFSTNAGVANGLNAKLAAASQAANANARAGQLGAFQNQVNAQTGKALTAGQAAILLRLVQAMY
jgi:endonuclease G